MNKKRAILLTAALMLAFILSSTLVAAEFTTKEFISKLFSKATLYVIVNTVILFAIIFVFQAFAMPDKDEKHKIAMYSIIVMSALLASIFLFKEGYIWNAGPLMPYIHLKVLINVAIISGTLLVLKGMFLDARIGENQSAKVGAILLILLIGTMWSISTVNDKLKEIGGREAFSVEAKKEYYSTEYKYVWQKESVAKFRLYFFGNPECSVSRGQGDKLEQKGCYTDEDLNILLGKSTMSRLSNNIEHFHDVNDPQINGFGILRPPQLFVFVLATFIFLWLFVAVIKVADGAGENSRLINWGLAIILAAGMAHDGVKIHTAAKLAQWVAVFLFAKQFKANSGLKSTFGKNFWSFILAFGLVMTITSIAFPCYAIGPDWAIQKFSRINLDKQCEDRIPYHADPTSIYEEAFRKARQDPSLKSLSDNELREEIIKQLKDRGISIEETTSEQDNSVTGAVILQNNFNAITGMISSEQADVIDNIISEIIGRYVDSSIGLNSDGETWKLYGISWYWWAFIIFFLLPGTFFGLLMLLGIKTGKSRMISHVLTIGIGHRLLRRIRKFRSHKGLIGKIARKLVFGMEAREPILNNVVPEELRRINVEVQAHMNYMLRFEVFKFKMGNVNEAVQLAKCARDGSNHDVLKKYFEKHDAEKIKFPHLEPQDTKERLFARIRYASTGKSFAIDPNTRQIIERNEKSLFPVYEIKEPINGLKLRNEDLAISKGFGNSARTIFDLINAIKDIVESDREADSADADRSVQAETETRILNLITEQKKNLESFEDYVSKFGVCQIIDDINLEMFDNYTMYGMWAHSWKFAKPTAVYETHIWTMKGRLFRREYTNKVEPRHSETAKYKLKKIISDIQGQKGPNYEVSAFDVEEYTKMHHSNWMIGDIDGIHPLEVDGDGWVLKDYSDPLMSREPEKLPNVSGSSHGPNSGYDGVWQIKVRKIVGTDWLRPSKYTQTYMVREDVGMPWLQRAWKYWIDDMRTGKYHPNSATFNDYLDYLNKHRPYTNNVIRGEIRNNYIKSEDSRIRKLKEWNNKWDDIKGDIRQPEIAPTYDKEALKDPPFTYTFWGLRDYWETDDKKINDFTDPHNPANPFPSISTVGSSKYISYYLSKTAIQDDERIDKFKSWLVYDSGAETNFYTKKAPTSEKH